VTATRLWLRLGAGTTVAAVTTVLIPIPAPTRGFAAGPATLVGCLAGAALFGLLAQTLPPVRVTAWTRRDTTRTSFFLLWAWVEETVWRRLALGGLALQAGWPIALVGSSLAFAATHRFGRPSHVATGLAFGSVYLVSGTLLAPVAMHAVYNALLDRAIRSPSRGRAG
jgi:membrane protease YdiL (CAAX protease family)